MIVSLSKKDVSAKKRFQLDTFEKKMEEINATKCVTFFPVEEIMRFLGPKGI